MSIHTHRMVAVADLARSGQLSGPPFYIFRKAKQNSIEQEGVVETERGLSICVGNVCVCVCGFVVRVH